MIIDKENVNKILCIKPRGIGDVILSTVVFDNLLKDFPSAKIDYLTEIPSKPLLEPLKVINEVLVFENEKKLNVISLVNKIRNRKYDLILDFYSNPRTALITFLSRAKYRAGFPYHGRKYAYNLFGPHERNKFHAAQLHLELMKNIGLSYNTGKMYFGLTDNDKLFADEFFNERFSENDFVVGISPSGGWASKRCDPVKFAEISDSLVKKYSAKILILWGPGDEDDALQIKNQMKEKIVFAPITDIRKMGALISRCRILIANDSGPMHIGTALETPVLSLHGPTNPSLQGPFGKMHEWIRLDELDCIGCDLLECPRNHECFLTLPIARIMEKIDFLIKKNNLILSVNEKN
jgi:lipopolysaccharide heptosyltransferase II